MGVSYFFASFQSFYILIFDVQKIIKVKFIM